MIDMLFLFDHDNLLSEMPLTILDAQYCRDTFRTNKTVIKYRVKMKQNIKGMETMRQIVIETLQKSFAAHEALGARGEELVRKNQFDETALRVDIECEEAIIAYLRKLDMPIRVASEEHGIVDFSDNPHFFGVLDGLDGSGVYKEQRGIGRYGTMFAIFDGVDPCYENYLAGGIMEHSTGRMSVFSKGGGGTVIDMRSGKTTPLKSSEKETLDKQTKIYIDEYFEINRKTFSEKLKGFHTCYLKSSAVYCADMAAGVADLTLECTRKGNLEIAVAYGLIKETGGIMTDLAGEDIGNQKYLLFGQKENLPIITACTQKLAKNLLKHMKESFERA